MRSAFVGVALIGACGRVGFDAESGSSMRKPITIVTSNVLADYPLLVRTDSDADLVAGARADGADLAFVAGDGVTPLDYEIESYAGGTLAAWVRVPSLTNEIIYLTYGGSAHAAPDPARVWPSLLGVWHFNDDGSARDSTSHGHTLDSMTPPIRAGGIAADARSFDGVTSLALADPPDGSLDMGTRSFSMSLWVFVSQPSGQFDSPFSKGGGTDTTPGYDVEIGTGDWRFDVGDGVHNVYTSLGEGALHEGGWVHLAAVTDRSIQRLAGYVNGVAIDVIDISTIGSLDSAHDVRISDSVDPYRGVLDELRLYDHALPPEWIAAEYDNVTSPGFVSVGPAESF